MRRSCQRRWRLFSFDIPRLKQIALDMSSTECKNLCMANESKFTPGPWKVVSDFVGPFRIVTEQGATVAQVGYHNSSEAMANAELIAASHNLYEAATLAKDYLDRLDRTPMRFSDHEEFEVLTALKAALAKAEGR